METDRECSKILSLAGAARVAGGMSVVSKAVSILFCRVGSFEGNVECRGVLIGQCEILLLDLTSSAGNLKKSSTSVSRGASI